MKNSVELSLPQSKTVCGYEIKKMPIGAFLKAIKQINDLPKQLMDAMFPGEGIDGVLVQMKTMTKDGMQALLTRALAVVPERVVTLFAQLSGISESKLTNDPNVGLDGLAAMMLAWTEVNGIENFMEGVRTLKQKLRTQTMMKTGSNG